MALVLADRVKETTTTTSTGTITLAGTSTGYQSFSVIGNGNTTYYTIAHQTANEWEVGIGTYTSSGTTLARTTVLASSNSGSLVNFSSGTKDVFVTYPAERSVNLSSAALTSGRVPYATTDGLLVDSANLTFNGTTLSLTGNQVISVTDNTNAALRVTQTGTGNSLLIEDSANPDSTPFVIDASGNVISGTTASVAFNYASTPRFEVVGTSLSSSAIATASFNGTAGNATSVLLGRGRGTVASPTTVVSGDDIGLIQFEAHDGTALIPAASILAEVDGTPATNDMPGRLSFWTTAAGASSPTERMRISKDGSVAIGVASSGTFGLRIGRNATGGTSFNGQLIQQAIQSDVTSRYTGIYSNPSTAASAFTLSTLEHFRTDGVTIGSGSAVTTQYGFHASNALTGATNNYGFYGGIASASGAWNLYMAGTANNYMAGSLGIGTTSLTGYNLHVSKNITGATTSYGIRAGGDVQSDVTSSAQYFYAATSTAAAAFTITDLYAYRAAQGTIGATSVVTNQYGYSVDSSLTGATNNYAYYSNLASATGRWNLYMVGTANNHLAGSLGVGTTTLTGYNLNVSKNLTGATSAVSIRSGTVVQSDVTTSASGFLSEMGTQAAAFTLSTLVHFSASQVTIDAASTVTNQYGFLVNNTLTGATNNYGFYGNIATGTNRWNLYMAGTAQNYLANNLLIGGTAARGTTAGTAHLDLFNGTAPAGTLTNGISLYSSSGDFNFMDSSGNGYKVGFRNVPAVGTKTGSYTLATGDVGKYVQVGSGGSITIPTSTFAEGDVVSLMNNTTAGITITCSAPTSYIAGTDSAKTSMTLATRGVATVFFISSTVCVVTGNVS